MLKLSILIPSLITRDLKRILDRLHPQLTDEVEVLSLVDNRKMTLSEKRNRLIDMASAEYLVFIDDDDDISDDYVKEILQVTHNDTDVIVFEMDATINGVTKKAFFSKDYVHENKPDYYLRRPSDKMVYKSEIAKKVKYKNVLCEDTVRADNASFFVNTETKINKVLYFYNHDSSKSECQTPDYNIK